MSVDKLYPNSNPKENYFGHFRVCNFPKKNADDKTVQIIFISNDSLNDVYNSERQKPEFKYYENHLPIFYTFDFPECAIFIEVTLRKRLSLFVRECECEYLYKKKRLGYAYPMRSFILNNQNRIASPVMSLTNAFRSQGRLEKYKLRADLIQPEVQCCLNFLKPVCGRCIRREKLALNLGRKWYDILERPDSEYTEKKMNELYNSHYN